MGFPRTIVPQERGFTMADGILISFEGNDGAGKTTALQTAAKRLGEQGVPVVITREPGGCRLAEDIRSLLLDVGNAMDPKTEALLYAAARREHLVQTILPALAEGKVILCDRFLDSSLAYQGAGRQLGLKEIEALNDFGLEGFRPDLTLFFGLDAQSEKKRMLERGDLNRLDLESDGFHQRVREGFARLMDENPERFVRIDASKSRKEVSQKALQAIWEILKRRGYGR